MTDRKLLFELRREFQRVAQPAKALPMQAYMKSVMPFHGVPTPIADKVFKSVLNAVEFPEPEAWRSAVLYIWRNARYREERYAAIALTRQRRFAMYQTIDTLPMYEEMIVTGAWWDFVDTIAAHGIGALLRTNKRPMQRTMLQWSRSADIWKRRTSILCQLTLKKETDLKLLYACIEPSIPSKEFFLRKAIGWALRQYAWTNPDEIRRYVAKNAGRLSPLSQREALKNIQSSRSVH
jgi:3-methyladenine DNA glycosylase AlkD